jgi:hypothetical protein|tara:strand:- start:3292 stop:3414 length:123 start_codon:yes stop_codon:yes gene_type:complete
MRVIFKGFEIVDFKAQKTESVYLLVFAGFEKAKLFQIPGK